MILKIRLIIIMIMILIIIIIVIIIIIIIIISKAIVKSHDVLFYFVNYLALGAGRLQ